MPAREKCAHCRKSIEGFGHNGQPLVDGRVCDRCNDIVIGHRLRLLQERWARPKPSQKKSS